MKKQGLVIGGAHPDGIGMAAARSLVKAGYAVTVTGATAAEVAMTPAILDIPSVVLDVCEVTAIQSLIDRFERLDALVNCAGVSDPNEFDLARFARTLAVNVTGTMRACVAAKSLLGKAGGAIVNIASMYSTFGSSVVPGYSASKGAVVQLTKSLAAAWAAYGIRVNAIAPGYIKTDMSRPLWTVPELMNAIAARTPMGRWGEPDECGDVIAFLCSREARFVTGVTIPVDGGYLVSG